jgi:hypothetical protein
MNPAVGYIGEPKDVANLVSCLVSKGSRFITGLFYSESGEKASLTYMSSVGQTVSSSIYEIFSRSHSSKCIDNL